MIRPPRPKHDAGAALVLAMMLAALASSIVAGLLWHQQLWLRQYDFQRDQSQAQSLARSGIDWARLILQEDARSNNVDHFGEQWAIRLPPTPLENGEIGGEITDQAQLGGEAKMAVHRAPGLRGDADRLAIFRGHEDGFDASFAVRVTTGG